MSKKQRSKLEPAASGGETQSLSKDEFNRAMEAERADHSPKPGERITPTSYEVQILEHKDRWGTIRLGSTERWGDGPVKAVDRSALAKVTKRNERIAKRGRLAAQAARARQRLRAGGRLGPASKLGTTAVEAETYIQFCITKSLRPDAVDTAAEFIMVGGSPRVDVDSAKRKKQLETNTTELRGLATNLIRRTKKFWPAKKFWWTKKS